jgi:outer membrane protein
MKYLWFAALVLLTWATASPAENYRIATVDLQRALNESEAGKKAKERFKVEVDKLQSDLEKQRAEIEKMKEDVEKRALVLKEEERREIEREYQRRLRDFQRTYKDAQADLQARDNELTAEILTELAMVILEYGEKSDYTLILEASNTGAVLYNSRVLDITGEIIEAYDAKKKSGKL